MKTIFYLTDREENVKHQIPRKKFSIEEDRKFENSTQNSKIRRNLDQSLSLFFRSWWGRLNLIGGVDAALEEESGNGWRYIAVVSSSTFNFLINQSSDGRERLSLSVENGRPQIWSITKIFPPSAHRIQRAGCWIRHIRVSRCSFLFKPSKI